MSDEVREIVLPPWVRELERGAPWYSRAAIQGRLRRLCNWILPPPPERVVAVLWAIQDWSHTEGETNFRDLIRIELILKEGWVVDREIEMTVFLQDHDNPTRPNADMTREAMESHKVVTEVKRLFLSGGLDAASWRQLEIESARKMTEGVTEQWAWLKKTG